MSSAYTIFLHFRPRLTPVLSLAATDVTGPIRAAILTLSDKGSRGERADTSGPAIRELLEAGDARVQAYRVLPDEPDDIAACLQAWADGGEIDLILTTGGTGLAPRDRTPEATARVIERPAPGFAEAIRAESLRRTPMAVLGRGIAGIRGRCLIINLPGSEKAVRESMAVILPALPHAVETLRGEAGDHPPGAGEE